MRHRRSGVGDIVVHDGDVGDLLRDVEDMNVAHHRDSVMPEMRMPEIPNRHKHPRAGEQTDGRATISVSEREVRRQRCPPDIIRTITPRHPRRSPHISRHPDPPVSVNPGPRAIVKRDPAPLIVRHPGIAVLRVGPISIVSVGLPVWANAGRIPNPPMRAVKDPTAIRR